MFMLCSEHTSHTADDTAAAAADEEHDAHMAKMLIKAVELFCINAVNELRYRDATKVQKRWWKAYHKVR